MVGLKNLGLQHTMYFSGLSDPNLNWGWVVRPNHISAVQSQKAVSAYFASEQMLPFGFAEQYYTSLFLRSTASACNN